MSITKTTHDKVCETSTEAEESQLQIYDCLFKNMRYTIEMFWGCNAAIKTHRASIIHIVCNVILKDNRLH